MKEKIIRWIMLTIGIVGIVFGVSSLVFSIRTDGLVFEPKACQEVFGCTPKSFLDKDFSEYNSTKDIYEYAYVNSKGELVIYFTDKQKEAALDLEALYDVQEILSNPRIEATPNYDKFTVTVYDEETGINDFDLILNNANKIAFIKFLKDDPTSDFSIYWKLGPYGQEELFFSWPDDIE